MSNYKLEIWKLDANKEFTMDDPYMDMEFPAEDYLTDKMFALIKENEPVIDCAGYRALIIDHTGTEIDAFDSFDRPI